MIVKFYRMKKVILLVFTLLIMRLGFAQRVIVNPFAAELSHPELNIDSVAMYSDSTVFYMTVENKADKGGWFCADKKIYIENPKTHERIYRRATRGIPVCPDTYNFKALGEKLSFSLLFPVISSDLKTINLIEDCDRACFYFKGIILDNKLNSDIRTFNKGMEYYTANSLDSAIQCFTDVVNYIPDFSTHVYGYAYYHLVVIYNSKGDSISAHFWLNQLRASILPNKDYFIKMIKRDTGLE